MIRVDERNLVRTADRLPRNLGSRAIGAEDHPRPHGNIGTASFGLDDDDGIAILITLDATKRSRQTRRSVTSRSLAQPFIKRFAIDHADIATVDRHVDALRRRRNHACRMDPSD